MAAALLTLVPVSLAIGLLLFGDYGTHRAPEMTPGRVLPALAVALLLGPVPVLAFGLVAWLAMWVLIIGGTLMWAMLRPPPLRH